MEEMSSLTPVQPVSNGRQETLAYIWEVIKVVLLSLAIIVPVRYFLVQPFFVKGASMEPTFDDNNYILIDEVSYRFHPPERGDIVVFRYPLDQSQFFIKRIIGLPGETIEIKNDHVTIYNADRPQGWTLTEKYLSPFQHTIGNFRVKVDPNAYFVLGDNRLRSSDSRIWGQVNQSLVTGRVFFRAFPLQEAGSFPAVNY